MSRKPRPAAVSSGLVASPRRRAIRPSWVAGALVLLAAAGGAWWWASAGVPATPGGPPNILLVTLDTTRADRLGAYGYAAARTPVLDRLARDGVVFERAVAAAPTTLPAHASLMTGRNPMAHGVRNNGVPLDAKCPRWPARFATRAIARRLS